MSYSSHSKLFSISVKIGLMLVAFWLALRGMDWNELKQMLRLQNRSIFAEASLLLLAQVLFGAVRWRLILVALSGAGGHIISKIQALKIYYVSVFFNCCLPGTVGGDVVRVWMVKSDHTPLPLAISSVVIDRMMALLALGVMGGLTLPFLSYHIGISAWLLTPLFALLAAFGIWVLFNLDRIILRIPFLRSLHWLENLLHNLRLMFMRPKFSAISILYAVVAHICYCLCAYVLAESLGSPISLLDSFTLVPWVLLIAIIPVSIGGWGLREVAMVYMLGLVGVPKAVAFTLSVQLGLLSIFISIPAGILWLTTRRQAKLPVK
jgi:uncharacterized protein (TIRG00374 family)